MSIEVGEVAESGKALNTTENHQKIGIRGMSSGGIVESNWEGTRGVHKYPSFPSFSRVVT